MAYNRYQPVPTDEKLPITTETLPEIDRLPPSPDLTINRWEKRARIGVATIAGIGTGSVLGVGSGIMVGLGLTLLTLSVGIAAAISLPLFVWFTIYYYQAFVQDDNALRKDFAEYNTEINRMRNDYKRKSAVYAKLWERMLKKAAGFSPEEIESLVDDPEMAANSYILQLLYDYSKYPISRTKAHYSFDNLYEKYAVALPIQRRHPEIQHRDETIQSNMLHRRYLGPAASFIGACALGAGFYALSVAILGAVIPPLGVGLGIIAGCLAVATGVALLHRYAINKIAQREKNLEQYEHEANEVVKGNVGKLDHLGEQLTRVKIKLDDKNDEEERAIRAEKSLRPDKVIPTPTSSSSASNQPAPTLRRRITNWLRL